MKVKQKQPSFIMVKNWAWIRRKCKKIDVETVGLTPDRYWEEPVEIFYLS